MLLRRTDLFVKNNRQFFSFCRDRIGRFPPLQIYFWCSKDELSVRTRLVVRLVISMFSTKMSDFYKNENCPTSHELLEFQNGELGVSAANEVRSHLSSCEFCSAEVEFYCHYPQADAATESIEVAQIPAPLYELAEALLKNRHADASSLNSLLKEQKGLVMDKA